MCAESRSSPRRRLPFPTQFSVSHVFPVIDRHVCGVLVERLFLRHCEARYDSAEFHMCAHELWNNINVYRNPSCLIQQPLIISPFSIFTGEDSSGVIQREAFRKHNERGGSLSGMYTIQKRRWRKRRGCASRIRDFSLCAIAFDELLSCRQLLIR